MNSNKRSKSTGMLCLDDSGEINYKLKLLEEQVATTKQFTLSIPLNEDQIKRLCKILIKNPLILIFLEQNNESFTFSKVSKFIHNFCKYSVSGYMHCSFKVDPSNKNRTLEVLKDKINLVEAINRRNAILTELRFLFEQYPDYKSPTVESKLFLMRFMVFYWQELLVLEKRISDSKWLCLSENKRDDSYDSFLAGDFIVDLWFRLEKLQLKTPGVVMDESKCSKHESLLKKRQALAYKSGYKFIGTSHTFLPEQSLSEVLIPNFESSEFSSIETPDAPIQFPDYTPELQLALDIEQFRGNDWFNELDFNGVAKVDLTELRKAVKKKLKEVHTDKLNQREESGKAQTPNNVEEANQGSKTKHSGDPQDAIKSAQGEKDTSSHQEKSTAKKNNETASDNATKAHEAATEVAIFWVDIFKSLPDPNAPQENTRSTRSTQSRLAVLREQTEEEMRIYHFLSEHRENYNGTVLPYILKITRNMRQSAQYSSELQQSKKTKQDLEKVAKEIQKIRERLDCLLNTPLPDDTGEDPYHFKAKEKRAQELQKLSLSLNKLMEQSSSLERTNGLATTSKYQNEEEEDAATSLLSSTSASAVMISDIPPPVTTSTTQTANENNHPARSYGFFRL